MFKHSISNIAGLSAPYQMSLALSLDVKDHLYMHLMSNITGPTTSNQISHVQTINIKYHLFNTPYQI